MYEPSPIPVTSLSTESDVDRAVLADTLRDHALEETASRVLCAQTAELAAMHVKYPKATAIERKPWTRGGVVHPAEPVKGAFAHVVPKQSITLFGEKDAGTRYVKHPVTGRYDLANVAPFAYTKTFKIGDAAEYHSYNLHYIGTIVAIGAKTTTIEEYGKKHRLDLEQFSFRNWDFDLAKRAAENGDTMNYI